MLSNRTQLPARWIVPALVAVVISTTAALSALPVSATVQDPADTTETKAEKDPVQQGLPLAPGRTITFTTNVGSWISVDVSPDGTQLVFDLLGDLYTLPLSGGKATPFSNGMAIDAQPRFSPDGTKVVFTSDRSGGEGVWIMSLDGKDTTQVTSGKDTKYDSPEWSPDGNYIVVTRGTKLHMYHVDGGSGQQLIEEPANLRTLGAAFGADATTIWYAQREGQWQYNTALPDYQLATYDLESGETSTRTSRGGSAFRPTLSPDGNWLVYGTRFDQQTGLRIRDLGTGEERWLAYPVQRDDQESRATFDAYPGMAFTPDSRELVTTYGGRLWRVPVDGSAAIEIPFEVDVVQHLGPMVEFDYPIDDSPTFIAQQIREAIPSPDGSTLAFIVLDRLWTMSYPNGTPTQIGESGVVQMNPHWSPDGDWVTYASWDEGDGGHVWKIRADGSGQPIQLTTAPALYTGPVFSEDGERVVVIRAPAAGYVSGESRGDAEIVWISADGGDATLITPAEGRGNLHFRIGEPDRVYAYGGGAVVSFRWDGLEEREHVRVEGASLVTLAPQGDQALAQVGGHVHVVTVPQLVLPDGQAPSINPDGDNFPGEQLTEVGGSFPQWDRSGRLIHWSIGNAHVVYDLDAAEAFADSVEAAEDAAEAEDAAADTTAAGEEDAEASDDDADDPRYEPVETRIEIEVIRDIPQGVAVLRGARVITMNDQLQVIENADIVVRNNRITYVGEAGTSEVPGDARIIDMSGMTIMPGYVDTHAHLRARGVHRAQNWSYVANLAYGVTTTRDPQTGTTDVLDYTDMVDAGRVLGPRIYSTGPGVFSSEDIKDLDHAREVLSRYSEYYDTKTIKQYVAGNREQRQWIIQAAREQGLMPTTEGSLDQEMGLSEIIDGYSGHEHSWPGFPIQSDFIRLAAESGIAYTPTILVAYGAPWAENYWYATENPHAEEKLRRFTPHSEVDGKTLRRSDGWFLPEEHGFRLIGETVKDLVEAGGKAGIGSHGQLQGLGYHWELWSVASGGMETMDALRVATRLGAEALGLDGDLGSIQPGMLADLVVLTANPLDNIRNSKAIRFVMRNGRLYDGDTLAELYPDERAAPSFYWQRDEPATAAGIGR